MGAITVRARIVCTTNCEIYGNKRVSHGLAAAAAAAALDECFVQGWGIKVLLGSPNAICYFE